MFIFNKISSGGPGLFFVVALWMLIRYALLNNLHTSWLHPYCLFFEQLASSIYKKQIVILKGQFLNSSTGPCLSSVIYPQGFTPDSKSSRPDFRALLSGSVQRAGFLLGIFVVLSFANINAATIKSTASGGNWSSGSTWVGGVVPVNGDNVSISDGSTVIIDDNSVVGSLSISGILQFEVTNPRSITVLSQVSINSGGIFRSAQSGAVKNHQLIVEGSIINDGTIDFSSNSNQTGAEIVFTGSGNAIFNCSDAPLTNLKQNNGVILNKGTSAASVLSFTPGNTFQVLSVGTSSAKGFLSIVNGTFNIIGSNEFINPVFSTDGNYTIPVTGGFWLGNQNATVIGMNGTATNLGDLKITNGTYQVGISGENALENLNDGQLKMLGGVMNVGKLKIDGGVCTIAGGEIDLVTKAKPEVNEPSFHVSGQAKLEIYGNPVITIAYPNSKDVLVNDIQIQPGSGSKSITGGKIQLGTAVTPAQSNFLVSGEQILSHLTVFSECNINVFNTSRADLTNTSISLLPKIVFDKIAPILTAPQKITIKCGDNLPKLYASLQEFITAGGTAFDNCTLLPSSFKLVGQAQSNANCPYTITRTYEISDVSGNVGQAEQQIVVEGESMALQPEVIAESTVKEELKLKSAMAVYTATQNGNWNDPATWGNSGPPTSADDVNTASYTVTVNAASSCKNITIGSGGTLNYSGTNTLTVTGDWTNNGTYNAGTNGIVEFAGNSPATISGSAASNFYNFTLNKGSGISDILSVASNIAISNLTFANGVLKMNAGTTSISDITNLYNTIPKTAGLVVSGGTLNTGNFSIENEGLIQVISGAANFGTNSGNSVHTQIDGAFIVSGGIVGVAGRLENTASGTLAPGVSSGISISNGTITLAKVGNGLSSVGSLNVTSAGTFNFIGGTIAFQNESAATTAIDLGLSGGTGAKTTVGGTFQFGNASTPAGTVFNISSEILLNSVTSSANADLKLINDITIGTLALNPSTTIDLNGNALRLSASSLTTYNFPIDNGSGVSIPVTINLTGGSFGSNPYIEVESFGLKMPNNASATNFLNRYWTIHTSGITNPVYDVTATYADADVPASATESKIAMGNWTGATPWIKGNVANTVSNTISKTGITATSFTFTGINNDPPTVVIDNGAAVSICSGSSVSLTTTVTGDPTITYLWTPATGLSATNISNPSANPAANTTYTVTITDGNGFTSTDDVMITVNALPTINSITLAAICSGGAFTTTPVNGTDGIVPAGTIYTWAAPTVAGITGTVAGTNAASISGTLTNTTNAPINVVYTVTPTSGSCAGSTFTVTVPVNPKPAINNITLAAICSGGTFTTTPANGTDGIVPAGTTYTWAAPTVAGITGTIAGTNAASISGTLTNTTNAPINVVYNVTPTSGGCSGSAFTLTVPVNPKPVATATPATQTICSETTASIALTSNVAGTTFSWTITNSPSGSITGGAVGNGTSIAQTLINTTPSPATLTYAVTPTANGCPGTPLDVVITVNPKPVLSGTLTLTVCSGVAFTYTAESNTPGTTFSWTRAAAIGISNSASAGNGNVNETLINTTGTSRTVKYKYTLIANGCSNSQEVNVTVTPTPTLSSTLSPTAVCGSSVFSYHAVPSYAGTTLTWTRSVVAGISNPASTGSGDINETLINTTASDIQVAYDYSLNNSGCTNTQTVTITVKAYPTVVVPGNLEFCPGDNVPAQVFTGPVAGTTFAWTNSESAIGLASSGSGNLPSFVASNSGSTPLTATINVRPSANACIGANTSFTIKVWPAPIGGIVSGSATVCAGSNSGTLMLSGKQGTVSKWQSSTNGGTSWTDIANTGVTQTYLNLTNTTQYRAEIKNGICPAVYSTPATITVNSGSVGGTVSSDQTICSGSNSGTLTLNGHTGNVLNWQYSIDNGTNWFFLANTTTTQVFNNLTKTTLYRAVVQNGTCTPVESAFATVTVDPVSVGGLVNGGTSVCAGSNSVTLNLSSFTGSVVKWQSTTNNWTTVTDIANTSTSLTITNLVASTKYRAVVQSGTCAPANSIEAAITVDPATVGGAVSGSATVCSGTNSTILTLSGHTGAVLRWESSTNNWATVTTIANTTATYTASNLTVATKYRAVVKSGGCAEVNSTGATLTVDAAPVGGTISGGATVCGGTNSATLTLSGHSGTIVRWESSVDNWATATSISNTTTTHSVSNLANTTKFRVVLKNATCPEINSADAVITVNPAPTLVITNPAPVCSGTPINLTAAAVTLGSTPGLTLTYWEDAAATVPYATPASANDETYYIKGTTAAGCFDIKPVAGSFYANLGTPVFALGVTSSICNGSAPVTYTATSANSTSLTYSLDATSLAAGNSINSSTGMVTFAPNWTGTLQITATATGCGGPSTAIHSVTVHPSPTVDLSASQTTVCEGTSITLTATNSGGVVSQALSGSSGTINLTIPSNSTVGASSSITPLPSSGGSILASTDLIIVTLNITHARDQELDIFLVDPSGTKAMLLSSDNGGANPNYTNTVLRTDAANIIGTTGYNSPPFTGTYRPVGTITTIPILTGSAPNGGGSYSGIIPATALVGASIDGPWKLRVFDDTNNRTGTLNSWSLQIIHQIGSGYTTVVNGDPAIGTVSYNSDHTVATSVVTPAAGTHTYTVTTTDGNGCSRVSAPVTVTVNPKPTPVITADYCRERPFVWLTAPSGYSNYVWSTGASGPTKNEIMVDIAGTYTVTVTNSAGCSGSASIKVADELVTNGNFELGPAGAGTFYTEYAFDNPPDGYMGVGVYGIGTNARPYYTSFRGAHDHTSGSGYYMIVDGTESSKVVWRQTITVTPNTDYYFSAWAINLYRLSSPPNYDPNLRFSINGTLIGKEVLVNKFTDSDDNPWLPEFRFYGMWNSGAQTTAVVEIRNLVPGLQQNDFGLDDISFGTLADVPFTITITNNSPACAGNIIDLSTKLTGAKPPVIYSWTGPNGFTSTQSSVVINNPTALQYGTYTVTAQDYYGCDPIFASVVVSNSSTPMIPSQAVTVCNGVPFVITPQNGVPDAMTVVPAGTKYTWTAPTGTGFTGGSAQATPQTSIGQTLTNTTTAAVTAVYTVTPKAGTCTGASFTVTVTVKPTATANAGTNQSICSGTSGVTLAGVVGGDATGGIWSGGSGAFTPNNTTLNAIYTPSAAEITAGSVTLTLTTTGGCKIVTSNVHITIGQAPVLSGTLIPVKCFGQSTGAIDLTVTNGGASPSFAWTASNGGIVPPAQAANEDLNGLVAGTYSVTVTATSGCKATVAFDIAQPAAALQVAATVANLSCGQTANGGVTLVVTGGTAPYSYAWTASNGGIIPSGQEVVQNPAGLVAGTYHYTVTDANLCSITNQVNVIQGADTAPVITTCPPEYTVEGCSVAAITGLPYSDSQVTITAADFTNAGGVASDNCAITTYTYQDVQSGTCPIEVTRIFILGDASSLTTSCQQKIHIVDSKIPSWATPTGSLDRTLECNDLIGFGIAQSLEPASTEVCSSDNLIKTSGAFVPSGSCSQAGTYINTWIVTDACGRTSPIFTQKITVVDTSIPTWVTSAGALNVTLSCDDAAGLTDAMSLAPEAFDLCSPNVTVSLASSSGFVAGLICGQSGWYTRTWQAKDDCGNTSVLYTQTILIEDKTKPVWVNPPGDLDRFLECSDDAGLIAAQALAPVASDNCDADVSNIVKSSPVVASSGTCPQAETITYTWTVADDCGNISNTYTQVIHIDDNTPPQILCPPNTAIGYGDSNHPDDTGWAIATDNCSTATLTYSDVNTPGSCVGNSTITRTWRAEDLCGNFNTCVQQITVQDIVSPIIACPSSVNTQADPAQTYATITLPNPTLSDDVTPLATLLLNLKWTMSAPTMGTGTGLIAANFKFNIGTTTISYNVTDDCGSPAECSFTVTVIPNDPPHITCPDDILQNVDAGLCSATVTITPPTATGSGVTISGVRSDGQPLTDPYSVGVTTITWTATNATGSDTCTQTVTVIDNQPPTFTLPLPFSECVERIQDATYYAPTIDITPARPEYYILEPGDKSLDLTGLWDNCCATASLTVNWRIEFTDPANPTGPLASTLVGTGQLSTYTTPILFPGDGVTFLDVVHHVFYWIEDCHGNKTTPEQSFDVTIKPRPKITKMP